MLEAWGEITFVVAIGLFGGVLLGLAARLGRFCTLGAIEDFFYGGSDIRLRMWVLAIGLAVIGSFTALAVGAAPLHLSVYLSVTWSPVTSIIGGLLFGYGMAMAGNCGYGALARLGGGDLRSFVIVVVMGITTYATLSGPLAWARIAIFPAPQPTEEMQGIAHALGQLSGFSPGFIGIVIGLLITVGALTSAPFRSDRTAILTSATVAIAIVSAWIGTGWVAQTGFISQGEISHTFAAPLGESILYAMTATGQTLSFGIGSVAGVWIGAFLGSLIKGHFRWESCEDPRELRRQIFGAGLMGVGAALALGCSIGQGLSAFSVLAYSAPLTLAAIFLGAFLGLKQLIEGFLPSVE
jgi:hypothetical protein